MKNYLKPFIVVFILTSLLAGVLLTQNDPVEQVKKQQDEKLQAEAAEFIQAAVLYYSVYAALPWFSVEEKGKHCFGEHTTVTAVPLNAIEKCIETFVIENTLRDDYSQTASIKSLRVTSPNPQTGAKLDTIVCFQPQSKVWQQDVQTHYNIDGTDAPAGRCHSQGGSEFCYWCTQ